MGILRLPQRFLTQPQYSPRLADAYADAEVFFLGNDGTGKDLAKGNDLSYASAPPTKTLRQHGYTLNFDGSDRLITARAITLPTAFTVFAWVRPDAINYSYSRIAETSFSSGFYLGSNNGNSSAAKYAFIVKNASLEGCIGADQVAGQRDFVCGTYGSLTRKLYVNGVEVASASATNPASPVSAVYVGHNSGGVNFWRGDIDTFGLFYRVFSPEEIWLLYNDPWRLLKKPSKVLYFTDPAAGITLSPANATQANVASTPTITQGHELTPADADQANVASTPSVTVGVEYNLSPANATQANVSSTVTIEQEHNLSPANATLASVASTPSLALNVIDLVIAPSVLSYGSLAVSLTQVFNTDWNDEAATSSGWTKDSAVTNTWGT